MRTDRARYQAFAEGPRPDHLEGIGLVVDQDFAALPEFDPTRPA